jgi:hypothetical protein
MTSQHQRQNSNQAQRWDGLPEPVCQQPDQNIPKGCTLQQLAGHQRKPVVTSGNKLNARVLAEAGVPRQQDARLIQPHMIEA